MIKLIFAGDFVPPLAHQSNELEMTSVSELLKSSDLAVVNLECPLTDRYDVIDKTGPSLKRSPDTALFVKELGFSVATLANNHILDQGPVGVTDTITYCNETGIKTVGAGNNLVDAREPLLVEKKGHRIAVLNYCEHEFSIAGTDSAGANPFDLINCLNDIETVRKNYEIIVLVIHGGVEHYPLPSPERRRIYRFLAEQSGVSAIISHHTHCPSAYEIRGNTPVFYGLGNFLFYRPRVRYDKWKEGYLVEINFSDRQYTDFFIHPYLQSEDQHRVQLLKGDDKEKFINQIETLNKVLNDENCFKEKWNNFIKIREKYYRSDLATSNLYVGFALKKFPFLFDLFENRKKKRFLLNLIRCEAHREILIEILSQNERSLR